MPNDWPGPCQCCVCKGVHCLVYHPGHDHRIKDTRKDDDWDAMKDSNLIAFMEWKP